MSVPRPKIMLNKGKKTDSSSKEIRCKMSIRTNSPPNKLHQHKHELTPISCATTFKSQKKEAEISLKLPSVPVDTPYPYVELHTTVNASQS